MRGSTSGTDDIINARVTSDTPSRARTLANAYASAFIAESKRQAGASFREAIATLQRRLKEIQTQLALNTTPRTPAQQSERESLLNDQATFRQRIGDLQVGAATSTGGASVLENATTPTTSSNPSTWRLAVVAGLVGLVVALGIAVFLDLADDRIWSPDDLVRARSALPRLDTTGSTASQRSRWRRHRVRQRNRPRHFNVFELQPKRRMSAPRRRSFSSRAHELEKGRQRSPGISLTRWRKPDSSAHSSISTLPLKKRRTSSSAFVTRPRAQLPDASDRVGYPGLRQRVHGDAHLCGPQAVRLMEYELLPNVASVSARDYDMLLCSLAAQYDFIIIDTAPVQRSPEALAISNSRSERRDDRR